ncbi:hypothetical protein [Flavobacterium akiainvivens]|nr:hypothetical protein [Flavobacterium akiainvivens]SFQ73063.1 hypothetical protein SAMN05444144_11857 [Flavobacterium akiainvivens]
MPLTFNSRDEHNQRINNALQRLMALTLVPGGWDDDAVNEQLKPFLLKIDELAALPTAAFVSFIARYKVDPDNLELLADALVNLSQKAGYEVLAGHAVGVYEHIQQSGDVFSLTVAGKLKALRS